LSYIGRENEEAIIVARKAAEILEPLMPVSHHILSIMYINAGRFEEGLQASKMAIELDANSYPGYRSLGFSLAGLHRYEEAVEAFKTAVLLSSRQLLPLVELSWVYSFSDKTTEIENIMEELLMRSKTEYISAVFLCCVSYYSKKHEKAIEYLELALEQRDTTLLGVKASPLTPFMRTDPRFQSLLKKMNFPE
jgi:tetratricopeptide (TPR) repeat protein